MIRAKALDGRRIVVTRPAAHAKDLVDALERHGAETVCVPTIRFEPPEDPSACDAALARLETYDWVCFTSQNGVRFTVEALNRLGLGVDALRSRRVAAVGPATRRAVERAGIHVAFVPSPHLTRELGRRLPDAAGARVLLLRAEVASAALPQELEARGAETDDVAVYRTVPDPAAQDVADEVASRGADWILFTSPSTVHAFVDLFDAGALKKLQDGVAVAAIGPVTGQAAEEHGFTVRVVAMAHTTTGLVEALIEGVAPHA